MTKKNTELQTIKLPIASVLTARERLAPLHLRFWNARGYMSVEDVILSAYIQGFFDHIQLEQQLAQTS